MDRRVEAVVRRFSGALIAALLLVLATAMFTGSSAASAAPRALAPASAPYPPVLCPTIAVSTTHPFPGQHIVVTGSGFEAHQAITLAMTPGSHVLAHVTTSASGTFSTTVTVPTGLTGNFILRAEGSGSDCPVDPITIQVSGGGGPHTPGSLPFTGVDILTAVAIALALIGIGVALTRGGRRRHRSSAHGRH